MGNNYFSSKGKALNLSPVIVGNVSHLKNNLVKLLAHIDMFGSLLQHQIALVPIPSMLYAFAQVVSAWSLPLLLAQLTPVKPFRISSDITFSRKPSLPLIQLSSPFSTELRK